jgi:hypothetical protein
MGKGTKADIVVTNPTFRAANQAVRAPPAGSSPEHYEEGDPGSMFTMLLDNDPEQKYELMLFGRGGYIMGRYDSEKGPVNLKGEPEAPISSLLGCPRILYFAPVQRDTQTLGAINSFG